MQNMYGISGHALHFQSQMECGSRVSITWNGIGIMVLVFLGVIGEVLVHVVPLWVRVGLRG